MGERAVVVAAARVTVVLLGQPVVMRPWAAHRRECIVVVIVILPVVAERVAIDRATCTSLLPTGLHEMRVHGDSR
jgi:hypothetical protein